MNLWALEIPEGALAEAVIGMAAEGMVIAIEAEEKNEDRELD